MATLHGSLRLRPVRIGFLVRPSDKKAVRKTMRLCTCLWGGAYNPIIPVCRSMPKSWRENPHVYTSGPQLTAGYLRFFEPDVFVEAVPGLAEEAGIQNDPHRMGEDRVIELDNFIERRKSRRPEPAFGLSIFDLYRDLYEKEFQFVRRHDQRIVAFEENTRCDPFVEAAFGAFPKDEDLSFIEHTFYDAFDPLKLKPNSENWVKVISERHRTPLYFTGHALNRDFGHYDGPILFVADPSNSTDLIDLWNIRLFKPQVLLLNIHWMEETADFLNKLVATNFRPLSRFPHRVINRTTVEFSRSISEKTAQELIAKVFTDVPKGSMSLRHWHEPIWRENKDEMVYRSPRVEVTAQSNDIKVDVSDDDDRGISFRSISPGFVETSRGNNARWANVLKLRNYGNNRNIALALPSTIKSAHRFHDGLNGPTIISSEGIVLLEHYKDSNTYVSLITGRDAIIGWLKTKEVKARPSDPGRVADQMLIAIGGFRGTHLLADSEILRQLDNMAKSVRRYPDGNEEEYADRTVSATVWVDLLKRRENRGTLSRRGLDDFVKAGALKLGLTVSCPNCEKKNWYSLDDLGEVVSCERCLKKFDFPQGSIKFNHEPWKFRVVGPFSVPDFAGGAYSTILSLRAFSQKLGLGNQDITYSTNLDLEIGEDRQEIDFALWYGRGRVLRQNEEPVLVFGEAKSFATQAITREDIQRMKRLSKIFPGAYLTFSILKDNLSEVEKQLISKLALWGRSQLPDGGLRAPVIVLTGTELFSRRGIEHTWKEMGGQRAKMAEAPHVQLADLRTLADATQQVYLGLPDYWTWWEERLTTQGQ